MGILEGKKAVILGASSGIGWAIAERFREQGAELIIAARREENLKKLSEKIDATAIRCDGRAPVSYTHLTLPTSDLV